MNNKYIYLHKKDNVVVYVGKGSGYRAYSRQSRNEEWRNLFNDDIPTVEILCRNLTDKEAVDLEQLVLSYFPNAINKRYHSSVPIPLDYNYLSTVYKINNNSKSGLSTLSDKNCGTITKDGRWQVGHKNRTYKAHRIVWVLHTKKDIPLGFVVDHIDRNPLNNNVDNLRVVSASDNSKNLSFRDSKLGLKHISEMIYDGKKWGFCVQWTENHKTNRKNFSIKKYKSSELALNAAIELRRELISSGRIYWNDSFDNATEGAKNS